MWDVQSGYSTYHGKRDQRGTSGMFSLCTIPNNQGKRNKEVHVGCSVHYLTIIVKGTKRYTWDVQYTT